MKIVGSGFHQRVEHTATSARHFGVVGVGLNLDFLNGFQGRDNDRAIIGIGDRNTIEQVIVAANRAAGDGDHRRTALIFHAVIGGRTDLHNVLRKSRHHERVAAQVGQIDQLLVIENLALRRVGRFHQRHLFGHKHAFGDVTNF